MHPLQQHILKSIVLGGPQRFAQMKPRGIESNKFIYHLRKLIRAGYIELHKKAYILTAQGKRYAEHASLEIFAERMQPKIVTMIVLKNKKGEYLLYHRYRVPFRNMISFPYGKVHIGERFEEAAAREITEKTGLKAKLALRGSIGLCIYDEEELVSHMLVYVYMASSYTGELHKETLAGKCYWGDIKNIPPRFLMPGTKQILKLLSTPKKNFFADYFLDVHEIPFDSA